MSMATIDPPRSGEKPNHEVGELLPFMESVCKAQRQLLDIKLGELGVAVGQDQFLLALKDDEAIPVSRIAERLSVRPSTVSKMTDKLQEKGWVVRSTDSDDARRTVLRLTEDGLAARETVRVMEAKINAELEAALDDREVVVAALRELDGILSKRLRRLR